MDELEKKYLKGFNVGYLLSQHDPELLNQILKTKESNEYIKGLNSGMKQHDREKLLAQLHSNKKTSEKRPGR